MASTTDVRNGVKHSWPLGESGWNTDNDANLKLIDNFGMHLSVKDRDLLTPPGSPGNGDSYILASGTLTGAWVGKTAGDLAMWSSVDSAWRYKTPRKGYVAYIEDEDILAVFTTVWQTGTNKHGVKIQASVPDKTTNATLTIAEILGCLLTVTSATAVALTLPTGTNSDAGLSMQIDTAFDWSVINIGSASGDVTMTANTNHTYVGNAVVPIGSSSIFRTRKTATNTFVTYRIG